jgi:hypothetical protein
MQGRDNRTVVILRFQTSRLVYEALKRMARATYCPGMAGTISTEELASQLLEKAAIESLEDRGFPKLGEIKFVPTDEDPPKEKRNSHIPTGRPVGRPKVVIQ